MSARSSLLVALGGILVAALGAIGVSTSGGTHLSFGDLDPWLVVYGIGLLVALGAGPYGLYERFTDAASDRDLRWDVALSIWGGIALVAGLAFVALGLLAGFAPADASGSLAIVGVGACALVIGTLLLFVLGMG